MAYLSLRFEIFKRDNFTCQYCGKKSPDVRIELEHVLPRVKGGTDCADNLVTSCYDCNHGKSDNLLADKMPEVMLMPKVVLAKLQYQAMKCHMITALNKDIVLTKRQLMDACGVFKWYSGGIDIFLQVFIDMLRQCELTVYGKTSKGTDKFILQEHYDNTMDRVATLAVSQ